MTTTVIINTDPLQFGMLDKDLKNWRILDLLLFCLFCRLTLFGGKTEQGVNSL